MKPRHLVAIATLASTSLTSGFDNNLRKFVRPQQRRPVVSRLAVVLRLTTNEDDSPRSYADDVFFRGNMNERGDFRPAESSGFSVPTFKWDTSEFRTLIIVIAFTAYPRIKDVFSALPPPNETEVRLSILMIDNAIYQTPNANLWFIRADTSSRLCPSCLVP